MSLITAQLIKCLITESMVQGFGPALAMQENEYKKSFYKMPLMVAPSIKCSIKELTVQGLEPALAMPENE